MIPWNETHVLLQQSMQKEIETMRELLSNMHQEERVLLANDKAMWSHLMEERSVLLSRLSILRTTRDVVTKTLENLVFPFEKPTEIALEQLFPFDAEGSCEILFLRDQMMTLLDRINHQNARNEKLAKEGSRPPELQPQPQVKRKNRIATLPPEELQ